LLTLVKGLKIIGGIDGGLACRFVVDFFTTPKPDGCQVAGRKKARTVETIRAL